MLREKCRLPSQDKMAAGVVLCLLSLLFHVDGSAPVDCSAKQMDIAFIVDTSASIGYWNFLEVKDFLKDVLVSASIDNGDVRVGVITFSSMPLLEFGLSDYTTVADVNASIDGIVYTAGSNTNTASGLLMAKTNMFIAAAGDRPEVDNVAILVADGESNVNTWRTESAADELKDMGVKIITMAIGGAAEGELAKVVSLPEDVNSFSVMDFYSLSTLGPSIFAATCIPVPTTTQPTTTTTTTQTTTTTTTATTTTATTTTGTTSTSTSTTTTITPTTTVPTTPTTTMTTTGATTASTTGAVLTTTSTTTGATVAVTSTTGATLTTTRLSSGAPTGSNVGALPGGGGTTTESVCKENALDLVFLVDSSSSVGEDNFRSVMDYLKNIIDITSNIRVGVATFSTYVDIHFNLDTFSSKNDIFRAIDDIPYRTGWTNTAGGFEAAQQMLRPEVGDRVNVTNIVVIITDGRSNFHKHDTVPAAVAVKRAGAVVVAVGVGMESLEELDQLVSEPVLDNRYTVAGFDDLTGLGEILFPFYCRGPIPVTTPATTTEPTTVSSTPTAPASTTPPSVPLRIAQCHDWCDDDTEPVSVDILVANLTLPKRQLSKSVRKRTSAFDARPTAPTIGTTMFVACMTPYMFFVAWDLLDAVRFLGNPVRSPGASQ